MATPVGNQQGSVVPSTHQIQAPVPPTPGGVSDVPTRLESAQPPGEGGGTKKQTKGYLETAILWVRDCIVWIFKKVFSSCFSEKPEMLPAPPQPPVREQPPEPPVELPDPPEPPVEPPEPPPPIPPEVFPPKLDDKTQIEVDFLNALDRLTDRARDRVYYNVGFAQWRWWCPSHWFEDLEVIGEHAIRKNPQILRDHMILRPDL